MAQPVPNEAKELLAKILNDGGLGPEGTAAALRLVALVVETSTLPSPAPDDRKVFMDVEKYAEHLRVSPWKVRQLVSLGLPHSRLPGGRKLIRIDVAAADAWVDAQGGLI